VLVVGVDGELDVIGDAAVDVETQIVDGEVVRLVAAAVVVVAEVRAQTGAERHLRQRNVSLGDRGKAQPRQRRQTPRQRAHLCAAGS
jgi:hypothetical protein